MLQVCMSQSVVLRTTGSSDVLSENQCLELGFRKSELQCFRCHDLARFELNELQESCLKCCQEKEERDTPRVSSFDITLIHDPPHLIRPPSPVVTVALLFQRDSPHSFIILRESVSIYFCLLAPLSFLSFLDF